MARTPRQSLKPTRKPERPKRSNQGETGFYLGEGQLLKATEMAILVEVEGDEIWIPKSQIHDDSDVWDDVHDGTEGAVFVSLWWAEKQGWL